MSKIKNNLYIGLMSGTSMDGIDAALVDCSTNTFIDGLTRPYSTKVKHFLNAVLAGEFNSLKHYCQLNTLLGKEFAEAVSELLHKTQYKASSIKAIGSHGQTLCHDANAEIPYTLQLGCAHTIAELTGITVVADFRVRDLIVGGQGAPFAPIYHQALFKDLPYPLAVVNIGGIANLSYFANENSISGYDLGPGNCLVDAWIQKNLGQAYDKNGDWAASGKVINPLLEKLLADPYFHQQKPKSIGKEYFSLAWLTESVKADYAVADVQTTLLKLTAITIAQGIQKEILPPAKVLVCGGGVHNLLLIDTISSLLPEIKVESTASHKVNPDFIEAMMFAWFAEKTLSGRTLNLSQFTGARQATFLGAIYPGINAR